MRCLCGIMMSRGASLPLDFFVVSRGTHKKDRLLRIASPNTCTTILYSNIDNTAINDDLTHRSSSLLASTVTSNVSLSSIVPRHRYLLTLRHSESSVSAAPLPVQDGTELHQEQPEDVYRKRGLLDFVGLHKKSSYERRPDRLNDLLSNVGQKKLKSSHLEKLTKAELYQYGGEHFYRLDLDESAKLAKHLRDYCLEEAKVRARAMDSGKAFLQESRMNAQRMHIVPGDPKGNDRHEGFHGGRQQSMTALRLEEISRTAQKNIEQMSTLAVDLRNHIDSLHDSHTRPKTTAKINQDLDTIDLLVTPHDLFDPKKEAKKSKAETQAREKAERKQRERDAAKKAAAASHTKTSFFGWPLQGEMGKVLGFHTFHHGREPSMVRTEGSRSTNSPEGSSRGSSVTSEARFQPWSGMFEVGESSRSGGLSGSTSSSSTSSRGRKDKGLMISEDGDLLNEKEGGIFKDRTRRQGEEFTNPRD